MSDRIPNRKHDIGSDGNQYWDVEVKVNKYLWNCLSFEEKREIRLFVDGVQEKINSAMDLANGRVVADQLVEDSLKNKEEENEAKANSKK